MRKNKVVVLIGAVVCLGLVSQVVERTIDETAVKQFVVTHFEEQDEVEGHNEFEIGDKSEQTFLERLGF